MYGIDSTGWRIGLSIFLVFLIPSVLHAVKDDTLTKRIDNTLENDRAELIELRRDIHKHPEVSGQEERTARVVADYLRALGLEVHTRVGGHGVVGVLKGEKPGPVVAYRADMDAVYSDAPDPVPFKSENPGVRHICGHDVHTTVALGVASALSSLGGELPGTVKFVFQPSEENGEGAKAMITDGVLENPAPEAIFAVHCAPLEMGQIGSVEGFALPGVDHVVITITGSGDLQTTATECSRVVSAVSTISPDPSQASSQDDSNGFIVAFVYDSEDESADGRWTLTGLVRASSEDEHGRAKKNIEEGLSSIEIPSVKIKLEYTERALPAMVNDPELVRSAHKTIQTVVGEEGVVVIDEPTPFFSEDFAFYQQHIPGAMYFLGVSNQAKGIVGMPHNPSFTVDEDAIVSGARTMSRVLLNYLQTH